MKNFFVLTVIFSFLTVLNLQAQQDKYTYLTDKKFNQSEDLFGYTFVPSTMEVAQAGQTKAGEQIEISAGSYKFGIARGNLFVKGEGLDGVHNINQINTTEFGFQLMLMNARDPKQQGHLKIFKLKSYVDALVFKANNDAQEVIFLLPEISKSLGESEKEYFTDRNDVFIEFEEDIWGSEIFPFFKTFMPKRVYQRVQKQDQVKISFIETERIIEKGKKKNDDVVLLMNEEVAEEEVAAPIADLEPQTAPVKEEIIEEEEEEDDMPAYFKVKKKDSVEEEVAEVIEEVVEETPIKEIAETESLFADDEVLTDKKSKKDNKNKKNKSTDKKVKIVTEYEILINDFVFNDDGSQEPIERKLTVKDWKMRQDESASNPNEVYQIEFETNKGSVYVYLNGSKRITKMDCGEIVYLMRGM